MPAALSKKKLTGWLLSNGFVQVPVRGTSHTKYKHADSGIAVTIPMHARKELSKKHIGMIIRELERAGFDRAQVRRELGIT